MRQFRRPTPTPTTLTALRALAGVLVAAGVLSAPVQISAQAPGRPQDPRITYLTGDSVAPEVFERVRALVGGRRCSA